MGKKDQNFFICLKLDNVIYNFIKLVRTNDGSLIITVPDAFKNKKGISQKISIEKNSYDNSLNPIIKESNTHNTINEKRYITYHTSGQVNYHGFTFDTMYMEPLFEITKINPFLILSISDFSLLDSFELQKANTLTIEIPSDNSKRLDFIISLIPNSLTQINNSIVFSCDNIFGIAIEILEDEKSLNLNLIYEEKDNIVLKPEINFFKEKLYSQNESFLKYQHALYKTEELIILPPNQEGIVKVIFSVEMRVAPWVRIVFDNPNLVLKDISRNQTSISFKVYDKQKRKFIKDINEIKIRELMLDAEIYEDDTIAPKGFI